MGKPISSSPETAIINHFSHTHPLQLSNYQPQQAQNPALSACSCCRLSVSGFVYTCTACNYFLHISCSKLPQQITHPFDQNHTLSLLPNPTYPPSFFNCVACGKQDNGFSYHCGTCSVDLHPTCSTMPLSLTHQSHHHHQLNLTFSPPYPNQSFSCDICRNVGSKEWLYRCNVCEFDAHLVCATSQARVPIQQTHQVLQQYQAPPPPPPQPNYYQVPGTGYSQAPSNFQNNILSNYLNNVRPGVGIPIRPGGRRWQQNGLSDQQVFQFLVDATVPGLGLLMRGLSGGGNGGGGDLTGNVVDNGGVGDGSLVSFNGDFSGMDTGAREGMDYGGFGGF